MSTHSYHHTLQTNAPGFEQILSQNYLTGNNLDAPGVESEDFNTPRKFAVAGRPLMKITKKKTGHGEGVTNGAASSRASSHVPTAHVMPNMSIDHNFGRSGATWHEHLPRSGSVDRLQHHDSTPANPSKRWGSSGNLMPPADEFQHLAYDTEATFMAGPSPDVYSRYRQQLHDSGRLLDVKQVEVKHGYSSYSSPDRYATSSQPQHSAHPQYSAHSAHSPHSAHSAHLQQSAHSAQSQAASLYRGMGDLEIAAGVPSGFSHTAPPSDLFSSDLTHWQQRHQEQLHRQHMEASQPMRAFASNLPGYTSSSSLGSVLLPDPHKLDAVKQAADNIIREKDTIIDRQKLKLLEYEGKAKPSNLDPQHNLLKTSDGPSANIRLQELQYENSSLKVQLKEAWGHSGSGDVGQLQRQLGKVEYELKEYQTTKEKELTTKNAEIRHLKEQMSGQDGECLHWRNRYSELQKTHGALKEKLDGQQRYLEDLPTADEQAKHHQEVKSLKEERGKYKQRVAELDKRLSEAKKGVKSRDGLIESLEQTEAQLKAQLQTAKAESAKLSSELSRVRDGGTTLPEDDLEELKYNNQQLKADCDRAKKLMESQHKRHQVAVQKYQKEAGQLEERLAQEEAAVTAMKDELGSKEQHLKKLRQSVKELGSQNQDLLEKNLTLGDRVKQLDKQHTGDVHKLERRLLREISLCFAELQSLVEVCVQRAEGQNPDISMLLGVKSSPLDTDQASEHDLQSLHYKVEKVGDMRKQIDQLKEVISTKLAEELGDNLNCTQQ